MQETGSMYQPPRKATLSILKRFTAKVKVSILYDIGPQLRYIIDQRVGGIGNEGTLE